MRLGFQVTAVDFVVCSSMSFNRRSDARNCADVWPFSFLTAHKKELLQLSASHLKTVLHTLI